MTKSSIDILNAFRDKLLILNKIREKQETLFSKGYLNKRDIEEVYAAVFIDAIVSFEAFIEQLFIGLLAGQIKHSNRTVKAKVSVRNCTCAHDLVCLNQKYFSWLPFENTQKIATIFFNGGRPFSLLDNQAKAKITKCLRVRHAFAHQSEYALKLFKEEVIKGLSLMPRERNPKSYLRSQFSSNPVTTYYQVLIGDLLVIAKHLC